MWNTPVPVLAALFSPITLTAGPVAAYNAAMIVGPVVSGLALVLALGVWVERWWPRAAAGLLYGFSPFVVAHSSVGHLNLVWAVLPPATKSTARLVSAASGKLRFMRSSCAEVAARTGIAVPCPGFTPGQPARWRSVRR